MIRPTGRAGEMDTSALNHLVPRAIFRLFSDILGYKSQPDFYNACFGGRGEDEGQKQQEHQFKNTRGFPMCLQNYVHVKSGKISPHMRGENKPANNSSSGTTVSLMILFFAFSRYETKLPDNHPPLSAPSCHTGK